MKTAYEILTEEHRHRVSPLSRTILRTPAQKADLAAENDAIHQIGRELHPGSEWSKAMILTSATAPAGVCEALMAMLYKGGHSGLISMAIKSAVGDFESQIIFLMTWLSYDLGETYRIDLHEHEGRTILAWGEYETL